MLTMDRPVKPLLVFAALVAIGVGSRFLDIAPNATAIAGCALFASWLFRSRALAVAVPLLSMAIADFFLGGYSPIVMATVYTCLALPALAGRLVGQQHLVLRSLVLSVACAIVFFALTNFAVWAVAGPHAYPKTFSGLIACYTYALPFFRMTLAGDCLTVFALFGAAALARSIAESPVRRIATV
jgi:hypothetical protein